ncbi:MAG TPA: cation transporter [Gaiellaceae bacterium]
MATTERPGPIQLTRAAARGELQTLRLRTARHPAERQRLERRARRLAWAGNGWHLVEFALALGAGVAAGSVALVGFGLDSLIEVAAAGVVIWLFSGGRGSSQQAERRAQQLIAASYALLVAYIGVEAVRDLFGSHHPGASWVGIGLAAFTAPTMPLLAQAKRDVGRKLSSSATVSEAGQNMICAYLSVALLAGLMLNAVLGWWWADPAAALVIAALAAKEGIDSWRGESCDCCQTSWLRAAASGPATRSAAVGDGPKHRIEPTSSSRRRPR